MRSPGTRDLREIKLEVFESVSLLLRVDPIPAPTIITIRLTERRSHFTLALREEFHLSNMLGTTPEKKGRRRTAVLASKDVFQLPSEREPGRQLNRAAGYRGT